MSTVRLNLLTATLVAATFPASVWATNGYFAHGISIAEKALAGAGAAYSHDTLAAAIAHLTGQTPLPPSEPGEVKEHANGPDLRDVRGQERAKRALEIAAAGRHHLLMVGSPWSGKSMLAARLPGILPGQNKRHP